MKLLKRITGIAFGVFAWLILHVILLVCTGPFIIFILLVEALAVCVWAFSE